VDRATGPWHPSQAAVTFFLEGVRWTWDGEATLRIAFSRRDVTANGDAILVPVDGTHERLPETYDADDIDRTGITGSRRHVVVRHLAEHPAFECRMVSRNPLVVGKAGDSPTPTS